MSSSSWIDELCNESLQRTPEEVLKCSVRSFSLAWSREAAAMERVLPAQLFINFSRDEPSGANLKCPLRTSMLASGGQGRMNEFPTGIRDQERVGVLQISAHSQPVCRCPWVRKSDIAA